MGSIKDRENKKRSSPTEQVILGMIAAETPKGRPKSNRETKKRVTFALRPSVTDKLQKVAYMQRKSMSEIIESLAENYIAENSAMLELYDKLKNIQ